MTTLGQRRCTAFEGWRKIAEGDLAEVAVAVKEAVDRGDDLPIVSFDDATGAPIELDLRGTVEDVLRRLPDPEPGEGGDEGRAEDCGPQAEGKPRGPGRPKLGVVAREVTLLPRHWEWLNSQPGGASVALRKLVEQARRANAEADRIRRSREAAYRFMTAMAGDLPGFEEALRALFAGDRSRFEERIAPWPADVGDFARRLAALDGPSPPEDEGAGIDRPAPAS